MTTVQRDALSGAARSMAEDVQSGNVQALRTNTIPQVAADFGGIANSATTLKPLLEKATITVDDLYLLDASTEPAGSAQTSFYCGNPVVVMNFTNLPSGKYGLAILHATGVPQPQQISLILSETTENHWMLAGFFSRPMVEATHDALWYWTRARGYAQKKMEWDAWLYYQLAEYLANPADFLASPNFGKLQREAGTVHPAGLPGTQPVTISVNGSPFQITSVNPTDALGGLDLEVHYTPNSSQLAQLRDPVAARKQAVDIMAALLAIHPDLRTAFRGIWVRADQGTASVYALDLPMNQIPGGPPAQANSSRLVAP